jgi:hypothetical protein
MNCFNTYDEAAECARGRATSFGEGQHDGEASRR